MARLVVFRGDARDSKSLDKLPVRIGRGPQNDIVLEDPVAKSVSRVHAEIRLESGRIMLVDLKSDNGIWVAGSRVSRVELKPNVVASIGPFRLQLETDEVATTGADSGTKVSTPPAVPSPRPIRPRPRQTRGRVRGRPGPNGRPVSLRDWRARPSSPLLFSFSRRLRPRNLLRS